MIYAKQCSYLLLSISHLPLRTVVRAALRHCLYWQATVVCGVIPHVGQAINQVKCRVVFIHWHCFRHINHWASQFHHLLIIIFFFTIKTLCTHYYQNNVISLVVFIIIHMNITIILTVYIWAWSLCLISHSPFSRSVIRWCMEVSVDSTRFRWSVSFFWPGLVSSRVLTRDSTCFSISSILFWSRSFRLFAWAVPLFRLYCCTMEQGHRNR